MLIIGILSLPVFSQANNAAYNLNTRRIDMEQKRASFGLSQEEFDNIQGSPYANESFIAGNIYKDDKQVFEDVLLRYNIFSDEIEIKKDANSAEEVYDALLKDPDTFVKIKDNIYVFVPFEGSIEKGHYFRIVSEETNFDLYQKSEVSFKSPFYARTTYERDRPASFDQEHTYYIVDKAGKFYELPDSKSKIIKVMSKKEKEVKSFIKKNKLNFKEEKDLLKLVKYYNSLL